MKRTAFALFISFVITTGLLYLILSLIKSGNDELDETPPGKLLEFIRLKKDESVKPQENRPKRPPKPDQPPPPMSNTPKQNNTSSKSGLTAFKADFQPNVDMGEGLNLEAADGEYLPIVKVQPVYPRRARARGIEGYVVVEFTVTEKGTVRDPVVVESDPADVFDQAAMDAALRFKYKPRVVNGEAIEVAGVKNIIRFNLGG